MAVLGVIQEGPGLLLTPIIKHQPYFLLDKQDES